MSKIYSIKEVFYTLQGEGYHSGRPAVFCRFSGCNFWNGLEKDRALSICTFCDTDFIGTDGQNGGRYTAEELAQLIASIWPTDKGHKFVVCTGGEPLLQLDTKLIEKLHEKGIEIAVESNGSTTPPPGIDWLTISPKSLDHLVVDNGNELKLVFPQKELTPELFENYSFNHFYLQPMDGENIEENSKLAIDYCKSNPKWKLSMQTHKYLGIE